MTVYVIIKEERDFIVKPATLLGDNGSPSRKRVLVDGEEVILPNSLVHNFMSMAELMRAFMDSEDFTF